MAFTVRDAILHVSDYVGDSKDEGTKRQYLRSVLEAYRELPSLRRWNFLRGAYTVTTVAPYSTGTISYSNSTRIVTLTGGTWPSWAVNGQIYAGSTYGNVESVTDSTHLVLDSVNNFGADIAAGSAFTIFRNSFDMPADFLGADIMGVMLRWQQIQNVSADEILQRMMHSFYTAIPRLCAFQASPDNPRTMAATFWPAPDGVYNVQFTYQKSPRALSQSLIDVTAGTITTSAGNRSVAGNGTAFTQAMVGSILRIGTTTDFPDSYIGQNPFVVERRITSVETATALTVDSAIDTLYSNVKYRISDPIDFPEGPILNAFVRCMEKHVAMGKIMKDKPSASAQFNQALALAMEADTPYKGIRNARVKQQIGRTPDDYPIGADIE